MADSTTQADVQQVTPGKVKKKPPPPPFPCAECAGAKLQFLQGGNGRIHVDLCSCTKAVEWAEQETLISRISTLQIAEIPNRYITAKDPQGVHQELLAWIKNPQNKMLFLYGDVGTGKTHSAIHTMLATHHLYASCIYLPTYKFIELRNRYLDHKFSRDKNAKAEAARIFENYHKFIKKCDFLILDELGQEKLSSDEAKVLFDILDARYAAAKITLCISNHSDDTNRSLNGKMLTSLVGDRIASRLKAAQHVYFSGPDKRAHEGSEVISKEEIESFTVPAKILTHRDDEHQIMTWLARNPAFETVSPLRRNKLTELTGGEEKDSDRPSIMTYENVWITGDKLSVSGPVCDHEDKRLYAILLKELANTHSTMKSGLKIQMSYRQILEKLHQSCSGQNVQKVRRQLDRLNRMSLQFKNSKGHRWSGPLITEILQVGDGAAAKLEIMFSHFMIAFYRAHLYTTFNARLSEKIMGDGSAFYLFFASHTAQQALLPVSFEKCKKLLAIPEDTPRKSALRRVTKATKDLIEFNILGPKSQFKLDTFYPVAGPSLLH